jgi:DNA modification methylase
VKALFYGDNLHVLRENIADESIDLIYLDPPFNSSATYNVLFKSPTGVASQAQIEAFEDTWHWNVHAETAFEEVMRSGNSDAADLLRAMRSFLGENDLMAYLAMMAVRLIELHRVLKSSGSLYLHCDPIAGHYLKLILDGIFGHQNFLNEIVWKRTTTKSDFRQGAKNWPRIHDTVFYFAKDLAALSFFEQPFSAYADDYVSDKYRHVDPDGRRYMLDKLTAPGSGTRGHPQYEFMGVTRYWVYNRAKMESLRAEGRVVQPSPGAVPRYKRYLDEVKGVAIGDFWPDINAINSMATERLGYPTQKPVALLERIIGASSRPGEIVLDPFCGCGTAVYAAQKLGREWIGIDITHLAISLNEKRLNDAFPGIKYQVHGTPKDLDGAKALAALDKYQFQWWAVSLVNAVPFAGKKKGADGGIDGLIYFKSDSKTTQRAIVSVKGGDNVNVGMLRDLKGVMSREKAPVGIFITLAPTTRPMVAEAASAGFFECDFGRFERLQIFTVAELLKGAKPKLPLVDQSVAFKKAKVEGPDARAQGRLL